ncbi:hypothetical protein PLESTB_001706000 [Pleodorina starrii]|uniref:tRNA (guanine(37)-N1)-methyltransferase n=1 Tax=Pleodorina starrii TaxID=330485 RepID=A0A9W6BZ86_9CHLO|nr:hypothetical protein PLESTB_001706000 [Pleodorina starrii]GLC66269.1 hypothetical protein PLESTF_000405800 [Pleodorina starrii]
MRLLLRKLRPLNFVCSARQLPTKPSAFASAAGRSSVRIGAQSRLATARSEARPTRVDTCARLSRVAGVLNPMECAPTVAATATGDASAAPSTSGREVPTLERDSFKQILNVTALRVPNRKCADMMKALRGFTLDRPRLRCIVQDGDSSETKLLLLEEKVTLEGLPPDLRALLAAEGLVVASSCHPVVLDYSMLSADAVLKRLLPEGVDAPSSFETVGHIAHLNLRDEQLPYRYLIGAVLLDKNPHLKTVVNKVGSIENEFRVFQMEVIGGEARLETEVTQHGAKFRLDFSQVYWNSRLESEHLRLVTSFGRGEVLVDMMAGIGPFAIPAAQRGLTVYANDLNPRSAHYLHLNARLNRMGTAGLHVFNMDGRAFLRLLCDTPGSTAQQLRDEQQQKQQSQQQQETQGQDQRDREGEQQQQGQPAGAAAPAAAAADAAAADGNPAKRQKTRASRQTGAAAAAAAAAAGPPPPVPAGFAPPAGGLLFDHVVMNLPASAIEFLDAFSGAFDPVTWADRPLPYVHCYTFKRGTETEADILAKAERYLGGPLEPGSCSVHTVRDVAPNKLMLCLSFRVPREVAFKGRT